MLPTILECFISVKMRQKGEFYPRIMTKESILYSYILKKLQPLVDNDFLLPKDINNKAVAIFQVWLFTILDSFISVKMR